MGYQTITQGLTLTVPTTSTKNWGQQLLTGAWNQISAHDHTGGGNGAQLTSASIAPNFGLTQAGVQVIAGAGPHTLIINFNDGNIHLVDVSGAGSQVINVTLSNPVAGASYKIFFKNAASPPTINWPVSVKWPQSQSPIWTEVLNAVDSVTLYYESVAGVYYADWQVNYG